MNWKEKIKEGMKLIKEGCLEQTEWVKCYECPFGDFCTSLEKDNWNIPSDEEEF